MDFPILNTKYEHVNTFINTLAPLVCNEYLKRREAGDKLITPATVLAQAAKESGWNLDAPTLFGIKGSDIELNTTEYINGEYVNIKDSFAKYPDVAGAIQGYFDLMQWDNYDDATSANTVEGELYGLTNDIGYAYATAPDYYQTTLDIINDFGLRIFNDYVFNYNQANNTILNDPSVTPNSEIDEDVVDAIYRGDYGNGEERKQRLEEAGYNYADYQARVDAKYYSNNTDSTPTESNELEIGQEVKFTGSEDVNGTTLSYTDRTYTINAFSEDGENVLLDIYGEHYAWVRKSEVQPI